MPANSPSSKISFGGAVFLGIGAMVGAGIFALLGEAGALAGSATWLAFALGAVVAALLSYVVVKLSNRYPSQGGLVAYLREGFGDTHVAGTAGWLFYMAGVIVTAMVSLSFGSYATGLFLPDDASAAWVKVFAVVAVIAMALVYVIGPKAVGRLQTIVMGAVLIVFVIFIAVTLANADFDLVAPSTYPPTGDVIAAVALTFFAYLGLAVVAMTAESIDEPNKNVPRATYLSVGIAGLLYVLISLGVYGTLTVDEVIASGDTALAKAAEPSLGQAGFTMMSIAALLATASSINANLFAAGNLTANLAESGGFPPIFGQTLSVLGKRGVRITVGLVLLLALFLDLSTIASVGSAIALVIFAMVVVAAIRLRRETGSNPVLLIAALTVTVVVLVLFVIDIARNEPKTLVAALVVGAIAVGLDYWWKAARRVPDALPDSARPISEGNEP